ncbi:MAG: NosD domain-containing protein [Methanosarcina sp.]|jgi:parallel beta-helix repeat protein|nr:NosD domain-containing protein [Methanosarcina sp.]MDD3874441.1 NosD domain-containing protein [Methanosarcina sp.]MDD4521734.1 NosD domain-containing protein [Methanosarcina sp.]HHV24814.1 PKD domain-containing protein [Methanosarcina sp.]
MSISSIGTATEITIQQGTSVIQNAVDSANSGDVIILKPGTYYDNVKVNKKDLIIKSYSGNPDDTIIKAKSSNADVFLLQADRIKINGLGISGATGFRCSAINLSSCSYCAIENNKLVSNLRGISFLLANWNMISKNTITSNTEYGIVFGSAKNNVISENIIYNNARGVHVGNSDNNLFLSNTMQDNSVYGFSICGRSDWNTIYDNYFSNTNMKIKNGIGNSYNTTKTAGENIIGGPYLGGNYWAKPNGTGFSQKAVDNNRDGISDSAYTGIEGSIYSDFLPLVTPGSAPILSPVADFSSNVTSGKAPLNVGFTDKSTGTPTSWVWDFGDGTSSTEKNPVHTYSTAGTYTVNLTVSNENGTSSKLAKINISKQSVPPVFPGYTNPPTDPNHDGIYEDVNGNGILDFDDVVVYYDNMDWIEENASVAFLDYNKNGLIDFDDAVKLYDML